MTHDDIIRMAQKAGKTQSGVEYTMPIEVLVRFSALVAAAEREACAKLCEEAHWSLDDRNEYAAAIRARGK